MTRAHHLSFAATLALVACTRSAPPSAVTCATVRATAAEPSTWSSIVLDGHRVGRARTTTRYLDGRVITRSTSELRLGRLGKTVEMRTDATMTEDAAGLLRAVHAETTLSKQTAIVDVSIDGNTADVRESLGGATHTRSVVLPGPLLGPAAIERKNASSLRATGDTLDYTTWSPALTAPQHVRCVVEALETRSIDGTAVALLRVSVDAEGEAQRREAWVDERGHEVRTAMTMPFGEMVLTQTRSEPAIDDDDMPKDFFTRTLVRSNVRLPQVRALEKLVVRLTLDDASATLPPLESHDERIVGRDGATAIVEIDRVDVHSLAGATSSAPNDPALLGASAQIDPTDPNVRAIAEDVTRGARDPLEKALRLTRWVSEHMTFDAGVAFAPSSEVAKDRHGTCAGYAVLLVALLRAAAIPARLDMGLVYVDGVFGGHAWAEGFIGGRFVPLDAAVPSDGSADAAHIALVRDALDKGNGPVLSALGKVLGHASIRVAAYAAPGAITVRVDPAAPPYVVDGATYTNHGLGLSMTAPTGYRYTRVDATWPDSTVLALEGADGDVTLEEHALEPGRSVASFVGLSRDADCEARVVDGRAACGAHGGGTASLSLNDGPTVFVLAAKGAHAASLLDAAAAALRISRGE